MRPPWLTLAPPASGPKRRSLRFVGEGEEPLFGVVVTVSLLLEKVLGRLTCDAGLGRSDELESDDGLAIEWSTRRRILAEYPARRKIVTNRYRFDRCDKAAPAQLSNGVGPVDACDGRRLDRTSAPSGQGRVGRRLLRGKGIANGGRRGVHTR